MKKLVLLLILFSFSFSISYSQLPDEQLTKDEAVLRIGEFTQKVKELENTLKNLSADIEKLKKDLETTNKQLKDCQKAVYDLLGATEADIQAFRQKLGVIEGKIRNMKSMSDVTLYEKTAEIDALKGELNELRKSKISVHPEFFNRIIGDYRDIKGLYREKPKSKDKNYTVGTWAKDHDCLWNIAGKIDIYGDPFAWPKIWQANTDIIRNPDIIYPGQVFKIPAPGPKTSDEIKAERKYWRHKRAALKKKAEAEQQVKEGQKIEQPAPAKKDAPKSEGQKGR